jgi:membrane-associated phospholipid phosphatase
VQPQGGDESGDDDRTVGSRALAEPLEQDFIGRRNLTRWPSSAGRAAVRLSLRGARRMAPHWVLALTLLSGLALISALTVASAAGYDAVVESDGIAGLDAPALRVAKALRSAPGNLVVVAFTNLGGTVGLPVLATSVAILLAVAWRQWTPVILMAATAAGALTITVLGKASVGRIRPPELDAVPPFEHSPSFPSGHALNSVALAGIVAYLLIRRQRSARARVATVTVAGGFALLIGLSRVYLGLHWFTDVLVAWTLGLAWLTTVITAHRLFLTVRRSRAGVDTC